MHRLVTSPKPLKPWLITSRGGEKAQILMGATGTGKTYTMSQVIARVNKPTLVIAHNKTLAGQLYSEFKEFFPENAVEYFVSYYDYYQPEAYVPSSDTYIEKDSSVNDEIDKLRHSATSALLERNDVIVVASVSCIYGLGSPKEYSDSVVSLRPGQEISVISCSMPWWISSLSGTTSTSNGDGSVCVAMWWRFSQLPVTNMPFVWSFRG